MVSLTKDIIQIIVGSVIIIIGLIFGIRYFIRAYKKRKIGCLVSLSALIILIAAIMSPFVYIINFKQTEIFSDETVNGHTITINEVGEKFFFKMRHKILVKIDGEKIFAYVFPSGMHLMYDKPECMQDDEISYIFRINTKFNVIYFQFNADFTAFRWYIEAEGEPGEYREPGSKSRENLNILSDKIKFYGFDELG